MIAAAGADGQRAIPRRSVGSWLLYDLANTTFSLGVVTLYYPGLLKSLGHGDAMIGTLDSAAALVILGPVGDERREWGPDDLPALAQR